MFSLCYGFCTYILRKEEIHILILGLDGAGKTTVLEHAKQAFQGKPSTYEIPVPLPTVGLNVGRIEVQNTKVVLWDLGGQKGLRSIWDKYYDEAHAIVYVVDANDEERIAESKHALERVLGQKETYAAPLLVFCNKQDQDGAMTPEQVQQLLGVGVIDSRACRVQGGAAQKGRGVKEALEWVVKQVKGSTRAALLRRRMQRR
eukprot:TRINITY_DN8558_c0_g1_i1.p3 TRINITY_DN8558_c0_g1~~TRINITY_DN8558_c0_g1_i1.p3  ORF type:complete len:215 (-),score=31.07 TRINITY_DN8558_c0_g1_i1:486-1091(-)